MSVDGKGENKKKLLQADEIQHKTQGALHRIEREVEGTVVLGSHTLDQLRAQGEQMNKMNSDVDATNAKLHHTQALHKNFHVWSGGWMKSSTDTKEHQEQIKHHQQHQLDTVREVFQQEKFSTLHREWRPEGMVLCNDTSVVCEDLFDPVTALKTEHGHWVVDHSLPGIDAEGWTYGTSFSALDEHGGAGSAESHWNSHVRRRKWVYRDQGSEVLGMHGFAARNSERRERAGSTDIHAHVDKIGYVPRELVAEQFHATGRSTRSGTREHLDEDSMAGMHTLHLQDTDIDATIDSISGGIDQLQCIGAAMRDEVVQHNQKVDKLEHGMQKIADKQQNVSAVLRQQLRGNH